MCLHPREGGRAVGVRGGLPQGRGWLDSGSATQESSPRGGRPIAQARPGRRSGLARRPWHAAGPVRKSRSRSVCFPAGATSLSTALLNSRPGSRARRAGGRAGHPLPQAQCPGTPAPASAPLAVTGSLGQGCRAVLVRPAGRQAVVAISGGRAG